MVTRSPVEVANHARSQARVRFSRDGSAVWETQDNCSFPLYDKVMPM